MMISNSKQSAAAEAFATRWQGRGYEKGESQTFWIELLQQVYGVETPSEAIEFEDQVHLDQTSFIDGYLPRTRVMIEQKSLGKDLRKPIRQSDGTMLTPYQQAQRYITGLPLSRHPRWIVTCNFERFLVYDMERPNAEPQEILLSNLGREYYRLQFLVDTQSDHLQKEREVSMQAGEIVGKIYDLFIAQYRDPTNPHSLRSLNILCVRLVFCLYAEDAGIFGRRDMFHDYLEHYPTQDLRNALIRLFKTLDTPLEERDPYLQDDLAAFPYTNGGLFRDEDIEIPRLTDEIRHLLLTRASMDFDWSLISPTIFGAVFESTLNPETRRSGGMHYTSIENIHKVIDPLFLDSLTEELNTILDNPTLRTRQRQLEAYQEKLARLTFFDPACGSGNFLTETYLSLRRLENRAIRARLGNQTVLGSFVNPIRVSIQQFYGIEINDFAVTVATTALWISEAQMLAETEKIVKQDIDFLPLKSYANIKEGNALRLDWRTLSPESLTPGSSPMGEGSDMFFFHHADDRPAVGNGLVPFRQAANEPLEYDYIIGNPPFVGYSLQSKSQKEDILSVFVDEKGKPYKTAGKIDYVAGWYYKAAQLVSSTKTRAALVSTNSITQGEQVAAIWKPLMKQFGIHIDFAHRTFKWDSEASLKAHVHVVIVGFSWAPNPKPKFIFDNDTKNEARNINPYLVDADDVFIESRNKPICDVPKMVYGNKPTDGGFLFLTPEEKNAIIEKDPTIEAFIRQIYGSAEYINNKKRYCLWLVNATPKEIRSHPFIVDRVEKVRAFRLASPKKATQVSADMPTLFQEVRQPDSTYIIVPRVSSERRRYIPMGFMNPEVIVNDSVQIIPNATLYHFGILESNVHMAWMRAVCGRLKSDYRYSKDVVYNNFPWPTPTAEQRQKIEDSARAILRARDLYPDSSLADLYDPVAMPSELLNAHRQNDRAVLQAYGFPIRISETDCVAELFHRYQHLAE